jgi:hypothetical protein
MPGGPVKAGKVSAVEALPGFLEKVTLAGRPVVAADGHDGFRPIVLDVFQPTEGAEDVYPPVIGRNVPAKVEVAQGSSGAPRRVHVEAGDVNGHFDLTVAPSKDHADALSVKCDVKLSGKGTVTAVGLALPIVIGEDEHWRRTTIGGGNPQHTTEAWRYDENGTRKGWPRWRLGGLLADAPGHYLTWKASNREAGVLPMDQGTTCPGWLDYSERQWGLTVFWPDIQTHAPAGIWMDAEKGVMTLYFLPPTAMPIVLTKAAPEKELSAEVELVFHDGPLPVTFQAELPRDKYAELLKAMDDGSRRSYLAVALGEYGARSADELIDGGIQPSMALSSAGGANYRMEGLCKSLGVPYDRNRAKNDPRKYGQELIHTIIAKLGGKTSFRF